MATLRWLAALVCATSLMSCGGGSGSDAPTSLGPFINGIAATGKPITNATVSFKCVAGSPGATTTDSNGAWRASFYGTTLPCIARVQSGSLLLHAAINGYASVNITPVSELYMSVMLGGGSTADFFSTFTPAKVSTLNSYLTNEPRIVSKLATVANHGFSFVAGKNISNILSSPFTAAPGDVYDGYLETMSAWLSANGKTIQDVAKDLLSNDSCRTEPVC